MAMGGVGTLDHICAYGCTFRKISGCTHTQGLPCTRSAFRPTNNCPGHFLENTFQGVAWRRNLATRSVCVLQTHGSCYASWHFMTNYGSPRWALHCLPWAPACTGKYVLTRVNCLAYPKSVLIKSDRIRAWGMPRSITKSIVPIADCRMQLWENSMQCEKNVHADLTVWMLQMHGATLALARQSP